MQSNDEIELETLNLAAQDVRRILDQQRNLEQNLTTKLNILFVTNSAFLTFLAVSRLLAVLSLFSVVEIFVFGANFTLLIQAFIPRPIAISPNLEDSNSFERDLALSPDDYQLQMIVNLTQAYNLNQQRLEDISQTLFYAAWVTWLIALVSLLHLAVAYFIPAIRGNY